MWLYSLVIIFRLDLPILCSLACRGPVAKFFGARFVREMRAAEPASTQPEIENSPAKGRIHNRRWGRAAFPRSSRTGQKKFATGPVIAVFRDFSGLGCS